METKHYVSITEKEMDELLKADKGWSKEESIFTSEIIYTYQMQKKPHYIVKVFSSIRKQVGVSKGCGKDAIRVAAVNTKTNKGLIKNKRINRVPGWDVRLKQRVIDTIKELNSWN